MAVNYSDIYRAFGEENPQVLYDVMRPQQGSQSFLDYWKRSYGDVSGNYLAGQTRIGLAGGQPDWSFSNYLGAYPWLQRWFEQSPSQRGEHPSLFRPNMRWNV